MKYKSLSLILTAVSMFSFNAYSWGSLQSQKVDGFSRYCHYSDGGVETVKSSELCPITNQSTSQNNGSPTINIKNNNGGFGSLSSQKINGFNRYCKYTDGTVLTVGSTDLCPITSQ
ncbi:MULTISPECIES: hypothetical protein [Vibrio]|uniref:Uncharacterized protein n=1 Tax=Vibrio algicola TaxID=2662262 RepID=A0A5Q0TL97_9VIBR|nr:MULTISPECIES: hypothetical protein [Vibrio]MBD1577427.1 hypothetical protein [Vibrio sp. S11_S32]